eukprot:TRINITY_DN856_c1_g1_i4.p1 TRINITY_DN856_c1_g1~~TRINITY_DN856_c1_g1_i4.p1  ORF type:complete len:409 (+),score=125.89 TRINITY_DN856_c1_g1_i4:67-1227(+)
MSSSTTISSPSSHGTKTIISGDENQESAIKLLAYEFMAETGGSAPKQKDVCTAADVPVSIEGLRLLFDDHSYEDTIQVSSKLQQTNKDPVLALSITLFRVVAFRRLGMIAETVHELEVLDDFDSPTYRYESYGDMFPDKAGTFVPFSLRVHRAELPHFQGNTSGTIDHLYALIAFCEEQIFALDAMDEQSEQNDKLFGDQQGNMLTGDLEEAASIHNGEKSLWSSRISQLAMMAVNYHILTGDLTSAFKCLAGFVEKNPQDVLLLSCIGRLHLQLGNVDSAEEMFQKAELCVTKGKRETSPMVLINRGYLALARGQYVDAIDHFENVRSKSRGSNMIASNNLAVAYLYSKELSKSIQALEEPIRKNPEEMMTQAVVNNLYRFNASV